MLLLVLVVVRFGVVCFILSARACRGSWKLYCRAIGRIGVYGVMSACCCCMCLCQAFRYRYQMGHRLDYVTQDPIGSRRATSTIKYTFRLYSALQMDLCHWNSYFVARHYPSLQLSQRVCWPSGIVLLPALWSIFAPVPCELESRTTAHPAQRNAENIPMAMLDWTFPRSAGGARPIQYSVVSVVKHRGCRARVFRCSDVLVCLDLPFVSRRSL